MLVVSLVLSAVLLLIVNGAVWLKRDPGSDRRLPPAWSVS